MQKNTKIKRQGIDNEASRTCYVIFTVFNLFFFGRFSRSGRVQADLRTHFSLLGINCTSKNEVLEKSQNQVFIRSKNDHKSICSGSSIRLVCKWGFMGLFLLPRNQPLQEFSTELPQLAQVLWYGVAASSFFHFFFVF